MGKFLNLFMQLMITLHHSSNHFCMHWGCTLGAKYPTLQFKNKTLVMKYYNFVWLNIFLIQPKGVVYFIVRCISIYHLAWVGWTDQYHFPKKSNYTVHLRQIRLKSSSAKWMHLYGKAWKIKECRLHQGATFQLHSRTLPFNKPYVVSVGGVDRYCVCKGCIYLV